MLEVFVTGGISLLSSVVTGVVTWFLTRKKYYSEVDSNLIENMKNSLDFYKQISDDNKRRLEEVHKRNDALEDEVVELRKQVLELMSSICYDLTCALRKTVTENKTKETVIPVRGVKITQKDKKNENCSAEKVEKA